MRQRWIGVAVAVSIVAVGCSDDDSASSDGAVTDAVVVDGSVDAATLDSTELAHDDNSFEEANSPWGDLAGSMIGMRFTPPGYPTHLRTARFFVVGGGVYDTAFRVRVFLADGYQGAPGTDVLIGDATGVATAPETWVDVDLSRFEVTIDSGEFYVAMQWLTPPGMQGADAQFLGMDQTEPDRRCWWYDVASDLWIRVESVGASGDRDGMIRAVVDY